MSWNAVYRPLIAIVVAIGAIVLAQVWFDLLAEAVVWKLLVTLVVIACVLCLIAAIRGQAVEETDLKKDKYLS